MFLSKTWFVPSFTALITVRFTFGIVSMSLSSQPGCPYTLFHFCVAQWPAQIQPSNCVRCGLEVDTHQSRVRHTRLLWSWVGQQQQREHWSRRLPTVYLCASVAHPWSGASSPLFSERLGEINLKNFLSFSSYTCSETSFLSPCRPLFSCSSKQRLEESKCLPPTLGTSWKEPIFPTIPYNPCPFPNLYTVSDTKERVMFKYYPHPAHHLSCVWLSSDPSRVFHAFSLATTLMSQTSCLLSSGSSLKQFTASSHPRVLFILLFKQTRSVFQDWVTISVELHQSYKTKPRRCWKNTFLLQK